MRGVLLFLGAAAAVAVVVWTSTRPHPAETERSDGVLGFLFGPSRALIAPLIEAPLSGTPRTGESEAK